MAMITCHECGRELSSEASKCPHCGAPNNQRRSGWGTFGKVLLWLFVILVVFLGYGCFKMNTDPDAAERARQRNAIDYCEDQYEALKQDPRMSQGALGIAYGACEKMKADFRQRWGREP